MRISCIADTHCTVPEFESQSLFPRQLTKLDREAANKLYDEIRSEIQLAYSTSMNWLRKNKPWNLLVHLGDITGGWKEQGCHHPSSQKLVKGVVKDLQGIARRVHFVIGNHDIGYSHSLSLPGSGINMDSIAFCRETLGNLFWGYEEEGMLSIGVCSPIAEYKGSNTEINRLQKDQMVFLGDILAAHKGPWTMYTHNPFVPKYFLKQVRGHTQQLEKIICGDYHDPRKGRLLRRALQIPGLPLPKTLAEKVFFECLQKSVFCPSTAPLWWRGYGLLSLSWENERLKSQEVTLNRPPESKKIPTSSLLKCCCWMIRRRRKRL